MPQTPDRPVYVLHGQDVFLQQQQCAELVRLLTETDEAGLATVKFDASAELSDVLDELRTAPLLAQRRIVIVRDADDFLLKHAESLEKYLASPARTGTLILLVESWPPKMPKTKGQTGKDVSAAVKSLAGVVRKVGELINCSAPSASAVPGWISQTAQARGKQMAPQATRLLAEWVGTDLATLDGEIAKLAIYVGDRKEISVSDVSAVAVAAAGVKPFALTNAIDRRNTRAALTALSAMMTRRGEEIRTLGMLAWGIRKTLSSAPRNSPAADKAGRATRKLLAADLAVKTGADPVATMQLLVMNLCNR